MKIDKIMASLEAKHPGEMEYLQAVKEVLVSIEEIYNKHPEFEKAKIIERLVEPDRIFTFRVTWVDDKGEVQTNLGYRVQFNNAIGPYKGGIRFHASVTLSILKLELELFVRLKNYRRKRALLLTSYASLVILQVGHDVNSFLFSAFTRHVSRETCRCSICTFIVSRAGRKRARSTSVGRWRLLSGEGWFMRELSQKRKEE